MKLRNLIRIYLNHLADSIQFETDGSILQFSNRPQHQPATISVIPLTKLCGCFQGPTPLENYKNTETFAI